jgi:hypothetical protein
MAEKSAKNTTIMVSVETYNYLYSQKLKMEKILRHSISFNKLFQIIFTVRDLDASITDAMLE